MTKRLLLFRALRCFRPVLALQSLLLPILILATIAILSTPAQAAPVISEFMAENDGFLSDLDGESPDWLELFNNSPAPVNLSGWHLTDTPTNLTRWTFPAISIPANGYLVVFASGKDRTNGPQLHTNFRLQNDGGYLALVHPDGVTIASSFSYPQQHRNVSYGPSSAINPTVTLLGANASTRWLLPSHGDLGQTWITPAFDDATWSNATAPLSFTAGIAPGVPVLSVDFGDDEQSGRELDAADTEVGFSSMTLTNNPSTFNGITVQLSALGGGVLDDRDRTLPAPTASLTLDQIYDDFIFVVGQTNGNGARVQITGLAANEDYRLTIWSFDTQSPGSRTSDWIETASGTRVITNGYTFDGSIQPIDDDDNTFGAVLQSSASGELTIEGRRSGGTVHGVFLNGLQLAPLTGFALSGNVSAMHNVNSSLYTRTAFSVDNTNELGALTLRVKYDDGFVAYLNGVEVARRNAPSIPDWNSSATGTHSSAISEDIVLAGASGLLTLGANTLSIHALNLNAADTDFFIEPQLIATLSTPLTNAFYNPATPGTANGTAFIDVVADTKFSVDRGFYDAPFALSITCATPGSEIRYTTNGSAPTVSSGFVFSGPIPITGNSFIRAQAFFPGWIPSGVDTHSYIFLRDVLRQSNNIPNYPTVWQASYPADYAMDPTIVNHPVYGPTLSNDLRSIPSLMIVSDHNGLWNAASGIYPNSTSTGPAWERATSVELINGNGDTEFATTSKIEMHGNASRDNVRTPKHSMRLTFSSETGPTRLLYDWFGGGVAEHDGIILRSCGFVDGWAGRYADSGTYVSTETGETFRGLRYRPENTCYLRDVWVKESFRDMGWSASRTAFVHLYINGLYWGLYEPSERLEASYFALHHGGEETAWDVLVGHDNGGPPVVVDGQANDWQTVLNIANAGITNEAAFQAIAERVDLDNLIDYMMLHIFAESEDWPHHNWFVAHRRATNGVPGTKFICTVWDQELTLDRLVRRNRINVNNSGGEVYGPGRVYAQLRAWPEFRRLFGDRVHKRLFNGGTLTPSNNVQRLLAPAALIRGAVVGESARWGDARETGVPAGQIGTGVTFTRDEWWQPEIDKLATNFFQKLTADNVARFRAGNLYPTVGAPSFNQFGGTISNGFALMIAHTNTSGVIYFTTDGSDPRQYGSGAVAEGAQSFATPLSINAPTLVRARVLNGIVWSALLEATFYPPQDLSRLALTELMYNPPDVGATNSDEFEFFELMNAGTNDLNLSGLTFSGISFTFTNGTILPPGAFFVLVRNQAAFTSKYPGVAVGGIYSGRLDNGGEALTLSHPFGGTIFSLTYDDLAPWPVTADSHGFSLVPINSGLGQAPDDGTKWRASTFPGGSPGAEDPAPTIPRIVINEILTHTAQAQVDTVELFNPTAAEVNLGGWFLTDDASVPQKYRITNGTVIAANSYLLLDELAHFNPTPGTNNSFAFSSSGEQVYLFSGDANTNLTGYSHGFAFGAAEQGYSFGRYLNSVGEEQFPAQRQTSFFNPNAGPRIGPVVINEIHYNPADGVEFIELKNISANPVPLFHPALPVERWRVSGIGLDLPTNIVLAPQGMALLVATNPAAFIALHAVPPNVPVFGPYTGALQNDGERIEVLKPDAQATTNIPYIVVDSVRYNDKTPWPPAPDGSGPSLQRLRPHHYGDDPINWISAPPSPGRELDRDGDGIPDFWELAYDMNVILGDAHQDPDGDGFSSLQEFKAGTNPFLPQSYMRVEEIVTSSTNVLLRFTVPSNRVFQVQFKDQLDAPEWSLLREVPMRSQNRSTQVEDPATNSARFYRLATP